jgi:predicted helicase
VEWQTLTPDSKNSWLVPDHAEEYGKFVSITDLFSLWTLGIGTNRDAVVYDWSREKLEPRIRKFIAAYNAEVHRHRTDPEADWPDHIDWSEALKLNVQRGNVAQF